MSQMLAPYNNSMRLGQGFNSYTQQICLDRAVLLDNSCKEPEPTRPPMLSRRRRPADSGKTGDTKSIEVPPALGHGDRKETTVFQRSEPEPEAEKKEEEKDVELQVMPRVNPQIVTYSSRFVDKLSDVTDAMNISSSLSIKTTMIGGKGNGSHVDSDNFKASDINFHLQIKVTKRIHRPPEYCIFNNIDNVEASRFTEVYGDTFISGWEEGGELNAVISIKVYDKAKVSQIRAYLEAEMQTPTIAGKLKTKVDFDKSEFSRSTETTISVNWIGGGSIKDPTEDWSIVSIKKAVAAFPDLVAVTPQRTYATLTKYTALEDFHRKNTAFSPLDYESAGVYTRALLDNYMDYKAMLKQISHAMYELKGGRATIEMAKPDEETYKLAKVRPLLSNQEDARSFQFLFNKTPSNFSDEVKQKQYVHALQVQRQVAQSGNNIIVDATASLWEPIHFPVFSPTISGLIHAMSVCRFEMANIVNEVDLVAKNPKLSTDATRDAYFLNLLVFEQLLPVVRSLSPERASQRIRNPGAALLLGFLTPDQNQDALPPVYLLEHPFHNHDVNLKKSLQKCAWKAQDYLIQGFAGVYAAKTAQSPGNLAVHSRAVLTNDLEALDPTFRLSQISIWSIEQVVQGICIRYTNNESKAHGTCDGKASHIWDLAVDGSEIIVEVVVREGTNTDKQTVISSIAIATSSCNVFDSAAEQKPTTSSTGEPSTAPFLITDIKTRTWARPEDGGQWSLRGFCTFAHTVSGSDTPPVLCSLGVVWSKDTFVPVPTANLSTPICRNLLGMDRKLQENIRKFKVLPDYNVYADKFLMGKSVVALPPADESEAEGDTDTKVFNALDDIDFDWTISKICFASEDGKLTGLRVTYTNSQRLIHGTFEHQVWSCEVPSALIVAKLTAGRSTAHSRSYVDKVEFIRADSMGQQSAWPLDVSTIRYLGEGSTRADHDVSEVVEQPPRVEGNSKWTIRGFYGEQRRGIITRLGVIWGRG